MRKVFCRQFAAGGDIKELFFGIAVAELAVKQAGARFRVAERVGNLIDLFTRRVANCAVAALRHLLVFLGDIQQVVTHCLELFGLPVQPVCG